jgi:NAD(P)-dependent dehydrogenase (short-subunit alcohol dehydrogenase family)
LGQQIVQEIVGQNGCVLATDTDTDKAESLFQALPSEQIQFVSMDITDAESVVRAIARGIKQFGTVDACVNAAYPHTTKWGTTFENLEMEDLQENLKLQLGGAIILSQRMIKHFVARGHGNFIHLSSIMGVVTPKFENYEGTQMTSPIEYTAIKSGVISMTS